MSKGTYIHAASTVSHQPVFRENGFSELVPLEPGSALINPDYKKYIDPALLRRMSKILRMSVAAAKDCLDQTGITQPDAIIVGTGLGCLQDTEKFLNHVLTVQGLLPPTSFIQSTHNTIAGQISLTIGNHGYNMTHTQNTLSFENALLDAEMLLGEGEENILLGAADEYIDILSDVSDQLGAYPGAIFTSGASFFILSKNKKNNALAKVEATCCESIVRDSGRVITDFLGANQLSAARIGMILYVGYGENVRSARERWEAMGWSKDQFIDTTPVSGVYPTASAFAMHWAADLLMRQPGLGKILIHNELNKNNLGLTLLSSVEA